MNIHDQYPTQPQPKDIIYSQECYSRWAYKSFSYLITWDLEKSYLQKRTSSKLDSCESLLPAFYT